MSDDEDDEYMEKEDEKPVVIQLKEGDLTEEQAARLAKGKKPSYNFELHLQFCNFSSNFNKLLSKNSIKL